MVALVSHDTAQASISTLLQAYQIHGSVGDQLAQSEVFKTPTMASLALTMALFPLEFMSGA